MNFSNLEVANERIRELEADKAALKAENEKYQAALEKIHNYTGDFGTGDLQFIAAEALKGWA